MLCVHTAIGRRESEGIPIYDTSELSIGFMFGITFLFSKAHGVVYFLETTLTNWFIPVRQVLT